LPDTSSACLAWRSTRQFDTNITTDYLQKILTARVYDVTVESPLELTPTLSQRIENQIYFKRENVQSVFSSELRGTYNKMASLRLTQLKRGVICASAGNHAQGLALSAAKLSCRAVIVMPTTTPQVKVDVVRARGGEVEVVLFGDFYTDAYNPALTLKKIEADIRASVRRSARDRRSGNHRHGNPAPVRPDRSMRFSCRSAVTA
jgi:threonine dehydratase